jgi:16S rRNA (cytidine1402-2'-O)-methyltransferase
MSGTLFLVATPIGNLEDITLRALRVFREVGLIAAEDTRRTAKLLAHYAIRTPTISFHDHSGSSRRDLILSRLREGTHVALVSDAGTPMVSDPGLDLVQSAIAADIRVDPVPGVSAPLAAAVASGYPLNPLTVLGFAPSRSKDRKLWLKGVAALGGTVTFFESPFRIRSMLEDASHILGIRHMCVAREVSKVHQEFLRGDAATILARLTAEKGEFTVVVGPIIGLSTNHDRPADEEIVHAFKEIGAGSGFSRRQIVSAVARKLKMPAREVYAAVERSKSAVI